MSVKERFLKYIAINTESEDNGEGGKSPSTEEQWNLAHVLEEELKQLGATDVEVSDTCVVYAHFAATKGYENAPAFGCIAHMDTVMRGENIKPTVIEDYDGGTVSLASGKELTVALNPDLPKLKGRTLIVSDGTTILGADDKAGVASIMNLCERIQMEKIPHGKLCVAFTPDEEIGCGVDHFDLEKFGADYAVTVDGGAEWVIECENFNAAHATVYTYGEDAHPGSAKGVMINAGSLLCEFQNRLPKGEVPEKTEGREGFYHLLYIFADVEHAKAEYLIREFDKKHFKARKKYMKDLAKKMNAEIGREKAMVEVEIKDNYYNMAEVIEKDPAIVENLKAAIQNIGMEPVIEPIRGGTDGARLSFEGLPCPNIGAGGYLFHSVFEHCTVEGMEHATQVLLELLKIYAKTEK